MKYVLITGGSRGIGAEMVRRFSASGACVAFTYLHSSDAASALSAETGAWALPCDVRNEEDVQNLYTRLYRRFRHLDVLISNAGTAKTGLLEEMSVHDFDELYAVHVRGAFLVTKAFLPMLRDRAGSIVYISSMWGQTGASCEAAYSSCKAALIGLTKALAREVAPAVRVNCVAPGVIDTDMMRNFSSQDKEDLISQTPLGRLGTPGDVAKSVEFLCSDNAAFITGQVLGVSGGFVI